MTDNELLVVKTGDVLMRTIEGEEVNSGLLLKVGTLKKRDSSLNDKPGLTLSAPLGEGDVPSWVFLAAQQRVTVGGGSEILIKTRYVGRVGEVRYNFREATEGEVADFFARGGKWSPQR